MFVEFAIFLSKLDVVGITSHYLFLTFFMKVKIFFSLREYKITTMTPNIFAISIKIRLNRAF